jgi:hypothetical protein
MYILEDDYPVISAVMSDSFFLVSSSDWERAMGKGDEDGNWSTLDGWHLEPSTMCYEYFPCTPFILF